MGSGTSGGSARGVHGVDGVLFALLFIAMGTFVHGFGRHVAATAAAGMAALPLVMSLLRDTPRLTVRQVAPGLVHLVLLLQGAMLGFHVLRRVDLGSADGVVITVLFVGLLVVAMDAVRLRPAAGRWSGPLLVATFGALALAWLHLTKGAMIDVLVYQRLGAERLLAGVDPYLPGYPDIYPPEDSAKFFAPGLSVDGVLQFGFPYPPLSLALSTLGHLLGAVRIAHVTAMAGGIGLVVMVGRGGWTARAGAALLATTPTILTMATFGWTESFLVVALAATVLARQRNWVVAHPMAAGALIGVKQYGALLALPLLVAPWGAERRWRVRPLVLAALVAAVLTLPLAVWHPDAFLLSVGELHLRQPFRPDSMSLLALGVNLFGTPPSWLFVVLTAAAPLGTMAWVLRRAKGEPWRTVLGVGLVMLTFLLVSKQAFVNYYFVVSACMTLSLALLPVDDDLSPGRP